MSYTKLHKEQRYVFEIANSLDINPKILHHKRPTVTCTEKLDLLKETHDFEDWTPDRIVKALYFSKNGSRFIGVITPELERNIKPKDVFPRNLMPRGQAERYWINPSRVPSGMSWGTCTPFILTSSIGNEISDLVFLNHLPIKDKLVDISIGGYTQEMFQTSMHIPYSAIYEILKRQFEGRVHIHNL